MSDPNSKTEDFSLYELSVNEAYEAYQRFRLQCPVAWTDANSGHWVLTRYKDVRAAAKDWQTFSSEQGVEIPRAEAAGPSVIRTDPPIHTEYRALFQEILNQKTILELQPYVIEVVHQLMDGFNDDGACDLVSQLTEQLPPAVICRLVGLDPELAFEMRDVSIRLGGSYKDPSKFAAAAADFRAFVLPQIEDRRKAPRGDFLTRLATEPFRGEPISDGAIVQMMVGFLLAGHESTTAAMSSTLFHLLSQPVRIQSVMADERLLVSAVEESLRLNTPFHYFRRTTTCPADVDGVQLPRSADVMLNYAAANRDPEIFSDPDTFVIDRRPNPHLAMGFGVHTCVGAPLARMELRVGIPEILRRYNDLRLACPAEAVGWDFLGGNLAFIRSLPVRFTPAPRPGAAVPAAA